MEALPITPAKASHQPVKPQVRHGFGDFFEVLLHEATLRLPARPTDLAAFQTRQASDEPGRRSTAAETISAVEAEDRRKDSRFQTQTSTESATEVPERSEPVARDDAPAYEGDDAKAAALPDDQTLELEAAAQPGDAPENIDGDSPTTADGSLPPVASDEGDDDPVEIATATGLPIQAQPLGAGAAAFDALARTATQLPLPVSAAEQAQLATGTTPSATARLGANGAASRVEVTPAAVVAQPNAALGGGAAAAALAAEAAQTAAARANPSNTTAAAAQTGQAIAPNPTAAAAAQLQNRSSGGPGRNGAAPGGQAHPGAGETSAQGTPQGTAPGTQDGHARVQSGPTASALALATTPEPGTATNAPIQADAERGTANPRNVQTPFAESLNTQVTNLAAQTAETGTRNGLARNARTAGAQTQTAQSQGTPVPSGETVEAAAERTTASTGLPQSAQSAASAGARTNAPERGGQAIEQATTGAANTAAKAMDRAVTPAPVQPAEGSGSTGASPSGVGVVGLMQAAARISAMMPAQARPAAASPVPLDQVAVHIQRAAAAGQDHIRIRLHPAELGQIDVKLKLAGDGVVKAVVTVDRPETFELLQRDARGLEKALQDAGLKTDSGSLSFNLRGQAQYGSDAGRGGSGFESQGPGTDPEAEPQIDPQLMAAANAASSDRLLDMRV